MDFQESAALDDAVDEGALALQHGELVENQIHSIQWYDDALFSERIH